MCLSKLLEKLIKLFYGQSCIFNQITLSSLRNSRMVWDYKDLFSLAHNNVASFLSYYGKPYLFEDPHHIYPRYW